MKKNRSVRAWELERLLPSGVIAISFGDRNLYDIAHLAAAAELYRSACQEDNTQGKFHRKSPF